MAEQHFSVSDPTPHGPVADELEAGVGGTGDECLIEYCIRNVDSEDRSRIDRLEVETREQFCLQRCGDCDAEPFVLVDGRYVAADHETIVESFAGGADTS